MRRGEASQAALLNHRFHAEIGLMADNAYLVASLNRLLIDHTRMSQTFYRPTSDADRDRVRLAIEQHDAMIAAFERRETALSMDLALQHWDLSRDQLERFVRPDPLPLDVHYFEADAMQFEGIYTPVVTPYFDDFSLNRDALAQTIDHLIAAGVHGLIVAGTTGEYYAQSGDERFEMMKIAKEMIAGRLPLIIGTGAIRTEDSIAFTPKLRKNIGADAILIATPPYAYPTGREIALHALAIDRAANLPAMLYNYPGRMSVNMDEETLDRLGRSPNFCGIKESSGDVNRLHMLARDYPHIALSCGMDDQALEFSPGARAVMGLRRVKLRT